MNGQGQKSLALLGHSRGHSLGRILFLSPNCWPSLSISSQRHTSHLRSSIMAKWTTSTCSALGASFHTFARPSKVHASRWVISGPDWVDQSLSVLSVDDEPLCVHQRAPKSLYSLREGAVDLSCCLLSWVQTAIFFPGHLPQRKAGSTLMK